MQNDSATSTGPWWRFGHVWLVLGGPAVVVAASLVTAYIAATRQDPVISEDNYRKGIEINKASGTEVRGTSLAPAVQARNHAATGVVPVTKP
jgi:hypothetical protein